MSAADSISLGDTKKFKAEDLANSLENEFLGGLANIIDSLVFTPEKSILATVDGETVNVASWSTSGSTCYLNPNTATFPQFASYVSILGSGLPFKVNRISNTEINLVLTKDALISIINNITDAQIASFCDNDEKQIENTEKQIKAIKDMLNSLTKGEVTIKLTSIVPVIS